MSLARQWDLAGSSSGLSTPGMKGKHGFWAGPWGLSLPPYDSERRKRDTRWESGRETGKSAIKRSLRALKGGRPAKLLASLRVPGLLEESSNVANYRTYLCPNKERFSLVASSTPQAGAETAKESRSFGLRKSKGPFRHPSKSLKLPGHCRQNGPWAKSPEEC